MSKSGIYALDPDKRGHFLYYKDGKRIKWDDVPSEVSKYLTSKWFKTHKRVKIGYAKAPAGFYTLVRMDEEEKGKEKVKSPPKEKEKEIPKKERLLSQLENINQLTERQLRALLFNINHLPFEAQFKILVDVPVEHLEPLCGTVIENVCNTEAFWTAKALHDYGTPAKVFESGLKKKPEERTSADYLERYKEITSWYGCSSEFSYPFFGSMFFPSRQDPRLSTAFCHAKNNQLEALDSLISDHPDCKVFAWLGAVVGNHSKLANVLSESFQGGQQIESLAVSAYFSRLDRFTAIYDSVAKPNVSFTSLSLEAAMLGNNLHVVKFLVGKEPALNQNSTDPSLALDYIYMIPATCGYIQLVKYIYHTVPFYPEAIVRSVSLAYKYNHPDVLKYLLDTFPGQRDILIPELREVKRTLFQYRGASPNLLFRVYGGDDYTETDAIVNSYIGPGEERAREIPVPLFGPPAW